MTIAGVTLTHADRVLYPDVGITKQDLASYYALVAPMMLPRVAKRPLSLLRCPDGQDGKCFYQKHWTHAAPELATVEIREDDGASRPYVVVKDVAGLVALVQFGVLEFHPWGSRADRVDAPDRITFDLDPAPRVPWSRVVEGARALRTLLEMVGLQSWLKTSGGKGLHVVLPISRTVTWQVVSAFARAVAQRISKDAPGRYVTVASKSARTGKVFIDHLRNSRGATAVAPWSTRARKGAPVAMPIAWDDLEKIGEGEAFTVAKVRTMLGRGAHDPWAEMPKAQQGITREIARRFQA